MKSLILPSVTSFVYAGVGDWRSKVKEIDTLGLKQVAVFVTAMFFDERQELYRALENTGLEEIPFVHIKSEMRPEEMEYFINHWKTRVFNHHLFSEFPLEYDLKKYFPKICIENTCAPILEKDLTGFGGLCLDFTHMEDARRSFPDLYKSWQETFARFPVGCGHISAIKETPWFDKRGSGPRHSYHRFEKLSDFDYLKNFSLSQFPPVIALELENSLAEQLKAKEYVEKILEGLD